MIFAFTGGLTYFTLYTQLLLESKFYFNVCKADYSQLTPCVGCIRKYAQKKKKAEDLILTFNVMDVLCSANITNVKCLPKHKKQNTHVFFFMND